VRVMVFLYSIVTGAKSFVHHYNLELKSQSLKYHLATSPRRKKFKTQPSAGKCMLTVFWDYTGIIHQEYMVRGTKINLEMYVKALKRLKEQIICVRWKKKTPDASST
jgi:hypothetical protein